VLYLTTPVVVAYGPVGVYAASTGYFPPWQHAAIMPGAARVHRAISRRGSRARPAALHLRVAEDG
jgi:hypothetical protein